MLERLRSLTVEGTRHIQDAVRTSSPPTHLRLYESARLGSSHTVLVTPNDVLVTPNDVLVTPNDAGDPRTISADVILLATGSRPFRPPASVSMARAF